MSKQLIPFNTNTHTCVFGRTRSGKTYGTIESLRKTKAGVFFFNVQLGDAPRDWVDVDAADDFDTVLELLQQGQKVNYMPSTTRKTADWEFAAIVDELYRDGVERDIYVVADECHLYKGAADAALERLATTGLRFGLKTVFISQRPAEMNYTLMTQATLFAVFNVSQMEWPYFKTKRFPVDEMQAKLIEGGEHAFILLDTASNEAIRGPFKV